MFFSVIILGGIGLLAIYSSSKGNFLNFKKEILFFVFGIFLFFLLSLFNWRDFKENPYLILFLYFLFCLLLISTYFFPERRGVHTWLKTGGFTFNPTEFLKIVLIVLLAKYFSSKHIEMYTPKHIFVSAIYVFFPSAIIFFQPDLGQVIVIVLIWLVILFLSGIRLKHFLLLMLIFVLLFIFSWSTFLKEYQKERILAFLFPYDPLGVSWSQNQSKIAIGSGGIFGQGIKKGGQTQLGFLTAPTTDFIFSVIAEEMGLIGVFLILALFLILFWRIMKIALSTNENFPKLFAGGFCALLFFQVFINIGMNLGLLPVIGIPLPFISYGGSNLLANFIALGILQNIKVNS